MVLLPSLNYEGISTDPHNGGPYMMYAGTPYAHIMVVEPVAADAQAYDVPSPCSALPQIYSAPSPVCFGAD